MPVPCFWLKVATSSGVKYARCLRILEVKFVVIGVEPTFDDGNEPFVTSFDAFKGLSTSMSSGWEANYVSDSLPRQFLNLRTTSLLEEKNTQMEFWQEILTDGVVTVVAK